ncbi:hypothetical protein RRG08_023298 [Elysia crispata]|uniref:Uncharacterized protein n=1 Tax=Elysia crispata TaxID=231223 RepID=A0AAE1EE75_9GAST|nr:hypothetical protein RRG08_023298 [Elysia crispata]
MTCPSTELHWSPPSTTTTTPHTRLYKPTTRIKDQGSVLVAGVCDGLVWPAADTSDSPRMWGLAWAGWSWLPQLSAQLMDSMYLRSEIPTVPHPTPWAIAPDNFPNARNWQQPRRPVSLQL